MKRALVALLLSLSCQSPATSVASAPPSNPIAATPQTGAAAMLWPDEEFRYTKPKPRSPAELAIPAIDSFSVGSGLEVYLVSRPELPTVSLWLSFPTGSIADPEGKRGRASVCMSLVSQGTKTLDKVAFEERQADLGSNIWARSGAQSLSTGVASLKRTLEPTLDLWSDMLRTPGMRQGDLDRILAARQASLRQNQSAPKSLAQRLWPSVVMGLGHPFGRLTSEKAYASLSRRDCRQFLAGLGPNNAKLFVAGAMTRDEVEAMIVPRLSWWDKPTRLAPELPTPSPRTAAIFFADVPGAAQSQVYLGHPGPARNATDYEANRLMAAILGGGFSSRVNMNIREDKGFAYGARASFSYYKRLGRFSVITSVRSDATAPALQELFNEIKRIRDEPVTPAEIERERQAVVASLPAMFSTSQRLLRTYSSLAFHDLPLDYYSGYAQRIAAVNVADVQASARAHLREQDVSVLIVGDGATVLPSLQTLVAEKTLGLQRIVPIDANGIEGADIDLER